jgi:hypothetical protein
MSVKKIKFQLFIAMDAMENRGTASSHDRHQKEMIFLAFPWRSWRLGG